MQCANLVITDSISKTSTISETITMDDPAGVGGVPRDFEETVEQLRERLAAMKRLVGDDLEKQRAQRAQQHQQRNNSNGDSIIDGKFLSFVFAVVLLLIICVSSYAFLNLYYAILKKFPAREHSEL